MADMDVDVDVPAVASKKDDSKKRFEVKKVCTNLHGRYFFQANALYSGMRWRYGRGVSIVSSPSIQC